MFINIFYQNIIIANTYVVDLFFDFFFKKNKNFYFFFFKTFLYIWFRVIWRGKAYRVRLFKKKNKFTFSFGYSHWTKLIYNKFIKAVKLKRQNYYFLCINTEVYNYIQYLLLQIRTMNKYTKRGIRIKDKPFKKRFGKISQVTSILHNY